MDEMMIRIGDKVKLLFDPAQGGMLIGDSLGLIDKVSIEVRRPVDRNHMYSQAYKYPNPNISHGSNWLRSKGYLRSKRLGVLPASYDILTKIDGLDLEIDFKLIFEESLPKVEMVKAWFFIKATKCLVEDDKETREFSLLPATKKFQQVYRGNLNTVTFTNSQGSLQLLSKQSNLFVDDRVLKQRRHAEYITQWFYDTGFPCIEEGTVFEGSWRLRYSR